MDKLSFDPISIIGRVAFGITCLEYLCEAWNTKDRQLNELIELLWSFTSSNDLSVWEEKVNEILPEYDYETSVKFGFGSLTKDRQEILTDIILEVIEIGAANLYGEFDSELSMAHVVKVTNMLESNNIAVPDLKPFRKSKVTEFHGWGNPVDKSFFRME